MNPRPAPARQSLQSTLVYTAVVVITVAWVAVNHAAYRELQALYDVKSEMLASLKRKALSDAGDSTTPVTDLDAATVRAPSETVAASALQRYLLERLGSAGGTVQSVQAEARRETLPPGLQRLSAQLAFDASIPALQRFLFDVETGLPLAFVDSLAAQPAPTAQPGVRTGDKVRVALTVTSYWKVDERAGGDR